MARCSIFIWPDLAQVLWTWMQAGVFISKAVDLIGTIRGMGGRILVDAGLFGLEIHTGSDLQRNSGWR